MIIGSGPGKGAVWEEHWSVVVQSTDMYTLYALVYAP